MISSNINKVCIGPHVLYHADCMDVLPTLDRADAVVTDPPWPSKVIFPGIDCDAIFKSAAEHFPRLADRAVIHLGVDTDPKFLKGVPDEMPFFRVCWLEYACPTYKGRLLMTGDVAYVYGEPPDSKPGARVLPGRCMSTKSDHRERRINPGKEHQARENLLHPCARRLEHVEWLVHWFTADTDVVLDCFMGIGTTGVACAKLGRKFIGVEIEEKYFKIACERIETETNQLKLFEDNNET